MISGRRDAARVAFDESLALYGSIDDRTGTTKVREALSFVAYRDRDFATALSLELENLRVFRQLGQSYRVADALNLLALFQVAVGDFVTARAELAEAAQTFMAVSALPNVVNSLLVAAYAALNEGDARRAAVVTGAVEVLQESIEKSANALSVLGIEDPAVGARAALGDEAYEAEVAAGRALGSRCRDAAGLRFGTAITVSGVTDVLRLPTYRRFLAGAICSGVGVWIFQTALYWAALQAGSTETVGILVALLSIPSLVLTIPAGYLTDRVGPFWLLFIGQAAPTVACIVGVAFVGPAGTIAFEPVAVVTVVVGIAYALWNVPALVYVTRVVEPRLMGSAIGLMVLQYAIGRIVGGALGGVLVDAGGSGLAFGVSAGIFGIGCLVVLTLPRVKALEVRSGSTLQGMVEAVRWLRYAPATLALVLLGAVSSLLSYAYIPLLGAVSRDVIGAGPAGLGTLTSTSGIGMVISALTVNTLGVRLRRGRGVVVMMLLGALGMAVLGYSRVLLLSVVIVAFVAFMGSSRSSLAQFLMQSISPPRMRGRIASLADFIAQLMSITGSLAVGVLAATWGASAVLLGCAIGVATIVGLIVLVWPRILALDVDGEAHPVIGGRPYVEGRGSAPLPESP